MARAKARICAGLTTALGRPAATITAATVISKPPVASSTTNSGATVVKRAVSCSWACCSSFRI
jgi:hypothetical protein